jgi:hypothetical protein
MPNKSVRDLKIIENIGKMHGTAIGRVRSVKIAKHQRGVFYTPVVVFQGQNCQQTVQSLRRRLFGIRIR